MTTERRHDIFAVALLVLLPTLLFSDVIFRSRDFYLGDITRFHYPAKQILRDIVSHGEFPYWNRLVGAGQPLAANPQNEVFYPPNWLIFLPDYDLGFRLQILFHIYVAAIGMYAMLRSLRLSRTASLFGAISFSLGGLFLSYGGLLPFLYSAAWIPLTLLFSRLFVLTGRMRHLAAASFFLGLQLILGEPTTVAQTYLLVFLVAAYIGWQDPSRPRALARGILRAAAIGVSACAVAAVQLIPMLDLVRDSVRRDGFPYSIVASWSMPPSKLAELVFPNILGHISLHGVPWYWAGRLYPGVGFPFVLNIYCGLAAIAFAAAGIAARIRGWKSFVFLLLLSVGLALGGYTPVFRVLYDMGIATTVRYPEKFIQLGVFSLIVFSAFAFDEALKGVHRVTAIAAGFALASASIAAVIFLFGFVPASVNGFLGAFGLPVAPGTLLMVARAWSDWSDAAVRGVALFVLLLTIYTKHRRVWLVAAGVFLCADLFGVVRELNPRIDRSFFTGTPELAAALPQNRDEYRIYPQADWQTHTPAAWQFFRSGPQSYWVLRNGLFPLIGARYGIATAIDRDYDKTALLPTTEFVRAVSEIAERSSGDWMSPVMAMSNAWYRSVYNDYEQEHERAQGDVSKLVPVAFFESEHQPRYYFADEIVSIRGRREFVDQMISARHSSSVAFIAAPSSLTPGRGVVNTVRESSNRAWIDVTAQAASFLVMSVTPHRYWHITIDGNVASSVVTNLGYQGVAVPAGSHRIVMNYRNPLIPIGAAISLISILSLIGAAFLQERRT